MPPQISRLCKASRKKYQEHAEKTTKKDVFKTRLKFCEGNPISIRSAQFVKEFPLYKFYEGNPL